MKALGKDPSFGQNPFGTAFPDTLNVPPPIQTIDTESSEYSAIYNSTTNILAPLSNNAISFSDVSGTRKVVLFSTSDYCSYQITFSRHESSVLVAESNVPYEVNVVNGDVKYFVCRAD